MDAGSHSISSGKNSAAVQRPPLQEAGYRPYMPPLSTTSRNPSAKCYGDRFIPDRSAMDHGDQEGQGERGGLGIPQPATWLPATTGVLLAAPRCAATPSPHRIHRRLLLLPTVIRHPPPAALP